MLKLKILNMKNFLDTVNSCRGEVCMRDPGDYMSVVSYYAGDC